MSYEYKLIPTSKNEESFSPEKDLLESFKNYLDANISWQQNKIFFKNPLATEEEIPAAVLMLKNSELRLQINTILKYIYDLFASKPYILKFLEEDDEEILTLEDVFRIE